MAEEEKHPGRPALPADWKRKRTGCGGWRCCFWCCWPQHWRPSPGNVCRISLIIWDCSPLRVLCVAIAFAASLMDGGSKSRNLRIWCGICRSAPALPANEQLDQLGQLIMRSQRSFKELIDSFDDVAFACSLDGTLRTVNRRMTELLDIPYTEIVGHKLDEFLDEPKREDESTG